MNAPTGYVEFRHYSLLLGGDCVRLSVADTRGAEYYVLTERPSRGWPEKREGLLKLIGRAIEDGQEPGEVVFEHVFE